MITFVNVFLSTLFSFSSATKSSSSSILKGHDALLVVLEARVAALNPPLAYEGPHVLIYFFTKSVLLRWMLDLQVTAFLLADM